jgi:hypothetical protein
MEKIADEWSSAGITTTLRVLFEDNKIKRGGSLGKVSTANCGFGWRFEIDDDEGTIRVFFDPCLLQDSKLGPLSISVKRKSVEMKIFDYHDQLQKEEISLNEISPLTTYEASELMTYPILSITVSFPPNSVQIPKPDGLLRASGALRQSLTGAEFLDTKFWCFSRRASEAGRVGDPRAVFGNSSILKNSSSYLDTRK